MTLDYLLVLTAIARLAAAQDSKWTVVSANTAAGFATTNSGSSAVPEHFTLDGASGQTYVMPLSTQPVSGTAFYMYSASLANMGTISSTGLSTVYSVVLTASRELYAGGVSASGDQLQNIKLNFDSSSNLYSLNVGKQESLFSKITALRKDPTNRYLYVLQQSSVLSKWEFGAAAVSASVTVSTMLTSKLQFYNSSILFVFGSASTNMEFVDKTTMTIAKTLTGSVKCRYFVLDNLNANIVYSSSTVSPYGVSKLDASGKDTYTKTASISSLSDIYSNILNFGPYQYIGLVNTDTLNNPFSLYRKADLQIAETTVFTQVLASKYRANTLVQGPSEGNKFFLAFQVLNTGVYNFQSYYIQFDLCTTRAGGQHTNGICPSCPTGYYLSEVNVAGNQCYPNGWGINSTLTRLQACSDVNCLKCYPDNLICTECDESKGYKLKNGKCLSSSRQIGTGYEFISKTAVVRFNSPVLVKPSLAAVADFVNVIDLLEGRNYTCSQMRCTFSMIDNGFSITFDTDVTILKGQIRVDLDSSLNSRGDQQIIFVQDGSLFKTYPIIVDKVVMSSNASTIGILSQVFSWLFALRLAFMLVLRPFVNPLVAGLLLRLFSMFRVHQLFAAPRLGYTNLVLSVVSTIRLIPVKIPEFWDTWLPKYTDCLPSGELTQQNYQCTFLDNYGQDLLTLLGILAVNIVISIVYWAASLGAKTRGGRATTPQSENPFLVIMKSVHEYYGVGFAVLLLSNVKLELMVFTIETAIKIDFKNLNSILSLSIGGALLIFEVVSSSLGVIQALRIQKVLDYHKSPGKSLLSDKPGSLGSNSPKPKTALKESRQNKNFAGLIRQATSNPTSPKDSEVRLRPYQLRTPKNDATSREKLSLKTSPRPSQVSQITDDESPASNSRINSTSLNEIFPISQSSLRAFAPHYFDAKVPTNRWYVLLPALDYLQALLLSLTGLLLSDYSTPQISVGLSIHVGYLLFIIKSNIKASRFEFGVEVGLRAVWVVVLGQALAFTEFLGTNNDRVVQYAPGAITAGLMFCMPVVAVFYALFCLISTVLRQLRLRHRHSSVVPRSRKPSEIPKSPEQVGSPKSDHSPWRKTSHEESHKPGDSPAGGQGKQSVLAHLRAERNAHRRGPQGTTSANNNTNERGRPLGRDFFISKLRGFGPSAAAGVRATGFGGAPRLGTVVRERGKSGEDLR